MILAFGIVIVGMTFIVILDLSQRPRIYIDRDEAIKDCWKSIQEMKRPGNV